jgi:hypothetical protein
VTILGHPEYGATLTDATGRYILAVNATHRLTLDLQAAGFIRAQRAVEAPMQQIAHAADVMLSVANPSATFVDLEAITEPTAALGSVESDDAGPRQGALLFAPGTTAAMTLSGRLDPGSAFDDGARHRAHGRRGRPTPHAGRAPR